MEEERRLAYVGITRAEEELFITNAQMRTLYGRTNMNPVSRFIAEIPAELIEEPMKQESSSNPFGVRGKSGSSFSQNRPQSRKPVSRPIPNTTGGSNISWSVGDKAEHGKWGTGTVVSVKGQGDSMELDIAFPSPTGVKRLLAKFAPVKKVT